MAKWLRWLSVAPSAVLAWFIAVYVVLELRRLALALCPAEMVFSGTECDAAWFATVDHALMPFGAGLAAVLVVLLPTVIAPSHRRMVAWAVFVVGAGIAAVPGIGGFYLEFSAAIVSGLLTALVADKRVASKHDA
jgi:hypothetical protein